MATAGQLVDRTYREYLHRGEDQPFQCLLGGDIDAVTQVIPINVSMLTPVEQNALIGGQVLDVNQEMMWIQSVDLANNQVTVTRGHQATTPASHDISDEIVIAPIYPRRIVFDAVVDAILDLFPDLWHTRTTTHSLNDNWVEVPAETAWVVRARVLYGNDWVDVGARFLKEFPDSRTGAAVLFPEWSRGRVILSVAQRFTRPANETASITEIEPDWETLVVLGAVIGLMGGTDLATVRTDFVTETFQDEAFPPGTGAQLAREAIRMYEYRLDRARRELARRYPVATTISGVTYGGF